MNLRTIYTLGVMLLVLVSGAAFAAVDEAIVVTATQLAEEAFTLPLAITPVGGTALGRRGPVDLRAAAATVSGVEVHPGGDMGPAGSVVAMQGLAEMDAYMIAVDGVPYGGAFNPATATLDPIDVQRIEILKGAAPVMYGATSFVGVANVIHHAAGEQPNWVMVQGGNRSSARAALGATLHGADAGGLAQSLLASAETRKFSEDRSGFQRYHLLWRGAADTGAGRLRLDLDATSLDQRPYSPHPREGSGMSTRFPLDANANPSDARQDQDRLQANLGLDSQIAGLDWVTTASLARTWGRTTRGFLREDFATDGTTINADGYRQRVRLTDAYLDSHVGAKGARIDWVLGADLMLGRGRQRSANFEYAIAPDGSNAPASTSRTVDESTVLTDRRDFMGAYGQLIVRPFEALTLLGGARLNRTVEKRCGGEMEGAGTPGADDCERRAKTRLAGSVGANFALWQSGEDRIAIYGDWRNSYKPAAIDFGPEAEAGILAPETTRSWEAGVKAKLAEGRLSFEADWFDTRFNNLVIRENIEGLPALANAGKSRLRGIEAEAHYRPMPDFDLGLGWAHHLARFVDYARLRPDNSIQQLAGKRLELSPKDVASAMIAFTPETGPTGSMTLRYTGSRFLNKSNSVKAEGFATLDMRLGWRGVDGWGLFVDAENLSNRRDPVVESELGDAQFYRLSGRRVLLTFERHI